VTDCDDDASDMRALVESSWRQLFDDSELVVGDDDNFFSLGASSLLAMRLVTMLRDVVGPQVELAPIMANPTVGGMAAYLETRRAGTGDENEDQNGHDDFEEGEL
jgi:aryl carrier-like protein